MERCILAACIFIEKGDERMRMSRILMRTISVFALVLGILGSMGSHEIAVAGDSYSDGKVVDNPGGGKRTEYNDPVTVSPSRDMSGGMHGGTYTHGQAVWFPQGAEPKPVAPPPPPPQQQSVSGQGGNYGGRGGPGDPSVGRDFNGGVTDTPPQEADLSNMNYGNKGSKNTSSRVKNTRPQVDDSSNMNFSNSGGNNASSRTNNARPMSAEERELWRLGILHKNRDN